MRKDKNRSRKRNKKINDECLKKMYLIFGIIAILSTIFYWRRYTIQKQLVQNGYNRAMYDFVSDINNIENEIVKLKISSNDTYTLTTLGSVFAKANSASSNLQILPFSENSTANVSKFLNQLGDFSYVLMREVVDGKGIEEFKEQIDSIYNKVADLNKVTKEIYLELNSGKIRWNELETIGEEKIKETSLEDEMQGVGKITKPFTDYEGLVYDGAFSEHALNLEPAFLTDKVLTVEEAENEIRGKIEIDSMEFIEEINGKLDLYMYNIKTSGSDLEKTMYVTKNDGRIYQMISNRKVTEKKLNIEDVRKVASEFLDKLKVYDAVPTYYLESENQCIISYAAIQDGVVIYPDLIKIKVAMDNGEILSFEANGYIYNHKEREIVPKYSASDARERLYMDLNIESEILTIIPTESKNEALAYEFKGSIDNHKFLVYINANTLKTERIFILLETEGGTMAI